MKNSFKGFFANVSEFLRLISSTRMLILIVINFIGSIPYYLAGSTLKIWLTKSEISLTTISALALASTPHALRFLWAPMLDFIKIPFLTKKFGTRRSWMIVCQLIIICLLLVITEINPQNNFPLLIGLIFLINIFIASYNILTLAWQMEIIQREDWGVGEALNVLGFRSGLILSGAGVLYLTDGFLSWKASYQIMTTVLSIGVVFLLFVNLQENTKVSDEKKIKISIYQVVYDVLILPFAIFTKKERWPLILLFMVLYLLPDHLLSNINRIFHIHIGFSNSQVATVDNLFGMCMTILGGFISGMIIKKEGYFKTLLIGSILNSLMGLTFIIQNIVGAKIEILYCTVTAQELTHGFSMTGFFAYQFACCSRKFAVSQLAVLNGLYYVGKYCFGSISGLIIETIGWSWFFLMMSLAGLPGLILLKFIPIFSREENSTTNGEENNTIKEVKKK